jgi:ABC-type transport system involved in Fe-S cluster assembly fused permease/ATPase subunit
LHIGERGIGAMIELDWGKIFETSAIAAICIAIIWFGYKVFVIIVSQWRNSTDAQMQSVDAVNKNTKAFEKLSEVFERQNAREIEFQEKTFSLLKSGVVIAEDTNKKVSEIHRKII